MQPKLVHGDIRGVRELRLLLPFYCSTLCIQANVLINDDLQPMLSDFGLAVVSDSQSAMYGTTSLVNGSIRWMAPVRHLTLIIYIHSSLHPGAAASWFVQRCKG
jgi:serine/threonine protein kinase